MKTKLKFHFARCFTLVLLLCLASLKFLIAQHGLWPSLSATPHSTGIETNCSSGAEPFLCGTCQLATVCQGEEIDFRQILLGAQFEPPPYPDYGCTPTYWAIFTSCSGWAPGSLYMPVFTTPGSVFTLNTATMPPGTYYIMAACGPINTQTGGSNGSAATVIFPFTITECIETNCAACRCEEILISMKNFMIDQEGNTGVDLIIPGPIPGIVKARVTLVNYISGLSPECRKCDAANVESYGDIVFAPIVQSANPVFGPYYPGPYPVPFVTEYSREVTWCYGTDGVDFDPGPIALQLKFPSALSLECCINTVNFCFRVELWDKECKACEILVCNTSGGGSERSTIQKAKREKREGSIKAIPNPAHSSFDLKTPDEDAVGTVSIYNANGSLQRQLKTQSPLTKIDTKGWTAGIYIIKYETETKSYQEKVVIEK